MYCCCSEEGQDSVCHRVWWSKFVRHRTGCYYHSADEYDGGNVGMSAFLPVLTVHLMNTNHLLDRIR